MMTGEAQRLAKPASAPKIGINLVKAAAVYMVAGVSLGILMGISQNFMLSSVHAHILLLGWVTMAITGLVYVVLPDYQNGWLAKAHCWGLNVGIPVMLGGLALLSFGKELGHKLVGPGAMISLVAIVAFTVNIFLNRER